MLKRRDTRTKWTWGAGRERPSAGGNAGASPWSRPGMSVAALACFAVLCLGSGTGSSLCAQDPAPFVLPEGATLLPATFNLAGGGDFGPMNTRSRLPGDALTALINEITLQLTASRQVKDPTSSATSAPGRVTIKPFGAGVIGAGSDQIDGGHAIGDELLTLGFDLTVVTSSVKLTLARYRKDWDGVLIYLDGLLVPLLDETALEPKMVHLGGGTRTIDFAEFPGLPATFTTLSLRACDLRASGEGKSRFVPSSIEVEAIHPPDPPEPPPSSLSTIVRPVIGGIEDVVSSSTWGILMGKALFWDQQLGSDGVACATCHYHAGADNRSRNALSPSLRHTDSSKAGVYDPTRTGGGGPNYDLVAEDFPFYVLADPNDRESAVLFDSDDIASSPGVFLSDIVSCPGDLDGDDDVDNDDYAILRSAVGTCKGDPGFVAAADYSCDGCIAFADFGIWLNLYRETSSGQTPSRMFDVCTADADALFNVGAPACNTRRVEPRNAPTVINAFLNHRNFWDGRASNTFNGQSPFGSQDPDAEVMVVRDGVLVGERLELTNASLASQAVGPPGSDIEMSARGRDWPRIGKKMLPRKPLAFQRIAADDSVLEGHIDPSGKGLIYSYDDLVELVFRPEYWSSSELTADGLTQKEHNFAMFFGIAVMLYESTLISDDTPFDRFQLGDHTALTGEEQTGMSVFLTKGKCVACHKGADFTGAGLILQGQDLVPTLSEGLIEHMPMGEGHMAFYDNGYYNIGVRPTVEDLGIGGTDPWGNPLSFTRQEMLAGNPQVAGDPDAVDGNFKTPGLRNVELTGPYFHNGGTATLEQVVDFYNRGGDRRSTGEGSDTTGFGSNPTNLDADIQELDLTAEEKSALVAFMKSLTDERVRWEKAPFDHPELVLPDGHVEEAHPVLGSAMAKDEHTIQPAVGRGGRQPLGLEPLKAFLQQ